jgi:hypothetical protein
MSRPEGAVTVVRWVWAATVQAPRRTRMGLCGYTPRSIAAFSMIVRTTNTAAFSLGASAGVMPLEASLTLDDFWLIGNRQSNCLYT